MCVENFSNFSKVFLNRFDCYIFMFAPKDRFTAYCFTWCKLTHIHVYKYDTTVKHEKSFDFYLSLYLVSIKPVRNIENLDTQKTEINLAVMKVILLCLHPSVYLWTWNNIFIYYINIWSLLIFCIVFSMLNALYLS